MMVSFSSLNKPPIITNSLTFCLTSSIPFKQEISSEEESNKSEALFNCPIHTNVIELSSAVLNVSLINLIDGIDADLQAQIAERKETVNNLLGASAASAAYGGASMIDSVSTRSGFEMFGGMAGYCSEEDYEKYFIEEWAL